MAEYKKVALVEDIKVDDVKINGQTVVDANKVAQIPIADANTPGVVQPIAKTDSMTQTVGIDSSGKLYTTPSVGTVTDVQVNNESVLEGTVAKISQAVKKSESTEYPFAIEDESGNVALAVTSAGDIKTKNFDSADAIRDLSDLGITATAEEINTLDGITASTAELNVLDGITASTEELNYVDGVTSNIQTQLDSKIADVKVDGTSVVDANHVAQITQPLKTESSDDPPFAIKDEDGNIVLQVDSTGNIQVKSFDSSQLETVIKSVVSLMGGTGIHISNNKICANITYEEIGSDTSPIVGIGIVGFMVLGGGGTRESDICGTGQAGYMLLTT